MEIKVNRIYWQEQKPSEEIVKTKWIYIQDILSIEEAMRSSDYTEVTSTSGDIIIIDESVSTFKSRIDTFITNKKKEIEDEEKRRDLGI